MKKQKILPTTEKRNEKSANIDKLSTLEIIRLINSEDKLIADAVGKEAKKDPAAAVDLIVERSQTQAEDSFMSAQAQADDHRRSWMHRNVRRLMASAPQLVQGIIRRWKTRSCSPPRRRSEDKKQDDRIAAIAKRKN
jgi:hypothetical protein